MEIIGFTAIKIFVVNIKWDIKILWSSADYIRVNVEWCFGKESKKKYH